MDCGVQVDAGKPLIIAEDRSKTLTPSPPKQTGQALKWKPLHWRADKWPPQWPRSGTPPRLAGQF